MHAWPVVEPTGFECGRAYSSCLWAKYAGEPKRLTQLGLHRERRGHWLAVVLLELINAGHPLQRAVVGRDEVHLVADEAIMFLIIELRLRKDVQTDDRSQAGEAERGGQIRRQLKRRNRRARVVRSATCSVSTGQDVVIVGAAADILDVRSEERRV